MVVIDAKSRYCKELLCCPDCQLTISLHTWRNPKILREWWFFCSTRWNSRFEHGSEFSTTSLLVSHCRWVLPKNTWSKKDVGSPKSTSLSGTFQIGSRFCFFPVILMSSTNIDKNNPCSHNEQRDIPNLEFSPSHVSVRFSQIAFPTTVLPTDDHTDSFQEERLGLPCWTMILAICVVVDESNRLDIPISEFPIICEHLPFLLGYKLILRLLLVHRNLASWRWYPWS